MDRESILYLLIAGAIVSIGAACASREVETSPAVREAEEMAEAQGESKLVLQDTFPRWRATAGPPGARSGPNAEVIVRGGANATTAHIDLDSGEPGAVHPWHIHSGECGDPQAPVVGSASEYPPMQVGDGGEGDAEATIGATLDGDGDYIVNVHLSPAQPDSIVACGELVHSSALEY